MSFCHIRSKRPGALQMRSKMLLYILPVVIVIFSAVILYVAVSSSAKVSHDAETFTLASSKVAALTVTDTITSNINILTTIAEAIPRLVRVGDTELTPSNFEGSPFHEALDKKPAVCGSVSWMSGADFRKADFRANVRPLLAASWYGFSYGLC